MALWRLDLGFDTAARKLHGLSRIDIGLIADAFLRKSPLGRGGGAEAVRGIDCSLCRKRRLAQSHSEDRLSGVL